MASYSLSLFGSFDVYRNNQPIDLSHLEKEQALLAYLAVEGRRAQRRELLATLLWPEAAEVDGRANLRQLLHRLRCVLGDLDKGDPLLRVSPQHIQLAPGESVSVDVSTFTDLLTFCRTHKHASLATCPDCLARMRAAVRLYRGEFLADWQLPNSAMYQDWVTLKQAELHNMAVTTLSFLARWHEQQGEYEYADNFIQHQLRLEPWSEDAHRERMCILVAEGKRTAALKQFIDCRRLLSRELGVEPSSETCEFYLLLQQDGVTGSKQTEVASARLASIFAAANAAIFQGRHILADDLIDQLAVLAQHESNPVMIWLAKGLAGINEFFRGDLACAQIHLEYVVNADASRLSETLLPLTGIDFLALCTHWLSWVHYIGGNVEQARAQGRAALARSATHPLTRSAISVLADAAARCLRDYPRPTRMSQGDWPLVTPSNPTFHRLHDLRRLLSGESSTGCNAGCLPQTLRSSGIPASAGPEDVLYGLIWTEQNAAGEMSQPVLLHISQLLKQIDDGGPSVFTAELYRLRGQTLIAAAKHLIENPKLQQSLNHEAEVSLRIAIDLAHTQHLRLWELRATIAICRYFQETGRVREALPLLTVICDYFPTECAWPDLVTARCLLQSLFENIQSGDFSGAVV